jgi:predicted signal transduction protein with EAL and GGDEF domain
MAASALIATFIAGLVCSAFVIAFARHQSALTRDVVAQHRVRLGAAQIEAALSIGDLATLETALGALIAQPDTQRVRLVVDGEVRLDRSAAPADATPIVAELESQALATETVATRLAKDRILVAAPLRANGRSGALLLSLSRAPPSAPPWRTLLTFLIVLPCAAGLAAHLLARALSDRLQQVRIFAQTLGDRGPHARLDLIDAPGLDGVDVALNRMAERIEQSQQRLQRIAFSDSATGLPNHERLVQEIGRFVSEQRDGSIAGLSVIRLERLERIYHAFGQESGDELLSRVVQRMRAAVRSIDRIVRAKDSGPATASILARLRNGEFAVLAPHLATTDDASRFAQLLVTALNQPFDWRENKLVLNAAVGGAMLPSDGEDPDLAIRRATMALSAAKEDASRLRFFNKAMDREAAAQLQFEREMRAAVDRNEFRAFYQPKIDLMSGRLVGAEALARWVRPDRTMVSPGRFIPAAEENGLIGAISEQILRDAIWRAASWAREGFPLRIAINISPLQFADERFAAKILKIMEEAGASPDRIELEITESMALENAERAQRLLEPLRSRGVKIAVDDFGCGHSSLASLTRMPFDIIKIDQQFVRNLAKDRHAPALIETILAMAASLNYEVVAEGIETEREMEFLRRRGCMIGQGFLFGAAMPAAEFIAYAESKNARTIGMDNVAEVG